MFRTPTCRAFVALGFVAIAAIAWFFIREGHGLRSVLETDALLAQLRALGWWGPVAVVALMTTAILISPLPSAPIALGAGAAYGHAWGTLYVVLGSEFGAVLAFLLARYLGFEFVHRHIGARLSSGLAGSQNALMATVFASRLMPFVSFDLVSYAAGLTVLSFGRFAIATLVGIIPPSFLLAHFGSQISTGGPAGTAVAVVVLGGVGLSPFVARAVARRRSG